MSTSPRPVPASPKLVLPADATLGECPGWDPVTRTLLWIDMFGQAVHRWSPADGSDLMTPVGQDIGAVVRHADGGLLCALRDGIVRLDEATASWTMVAPIEGDRATNRANDGKVDRAGRFWVGTMADDAAPGMGGLYRLELDGSVTTVLHGTTISNGLDWSPDDRLMYFVDSGLQRIDVFDYDPPTGAITGRRPFAEIPPESGTPDGMCVDAEGGLWVALWDGWAVRHYAPDGRLLETYDLPVSHVTSLTFGGDDLRDLYVTTAWMDATGRRTPSQKDAQPFAGALFRLRPGVRGQLPNAYGSSAGTPVTSQGG